VLFEVSPLDPLLLAISTLVLVLAPLAALYIPDPRAGRIDPMIILRSGAAL
jgi:hypothetical protein